MINDIKTNHIFISSLLKSFKPDFHKHLTDAFNKADVPWEELIGTKDIWCRDYMPIQMAKDKFVRFKYHPGYIDNKNDRKYITDNKAVCDQHDLSYKDSEILLEGGNLIHCDGKAIMTRRILSDNKDKYDEDTLLIKLMELLEVKEIIFVPEMPHDTYGHIDGMVRFVDRNNVLIIDSQHGNRQFYLDLIDILESAKIKYTPVPTSAYSNNTDKDAKGMYLNYLQVGKNIFLPVFDQDMDNDAIKIIEQSFKGHNIYPIISNDIAKEGGLVNCGTWNILK